MLSLASDYLDDPNNSYFTTTLLTLRLNLALKELQKRLILAAEQYYVVCVYTNTVVNQKAYALPTDFLNIVRLDYIQSGSGATAVEQKIFAMTPNQRDLVASISGPPRYYYFQNNNIIIDPAPDAAYEMHLEYTYFVADLVAGVDIPDAPQQFHEYIVLMAVRDCMVKDNRPLGNIEAKLKEYEELLKQMASSRRDDGARMIIATESVEW